MKTTDINRNIECPQCGETDNQIKSGFNNSGTQCYKCNKCGKRYILDPIRHLNKGTTIDIEIPYITNGHQLSFRLGMADALSKDLKTLSVDYDNIPVRKFLPQGHNNTYKKGYIFGIKFAKKINELKNKTTL